MAATPPRQPRPPEAQLIHDRRRKLGYSLRQAAAIAGNTEGTWRRVEAPGDRGRPAETVALLAWTVRITPEEMTAIGRRPDAAQAMAELPPPLSNEKLIRELRTHMQRIQEIADLLGERPGGSPSGQEEP